MIKFGAGTKWGMIFLLPLLSIRAGAQNLPRSQQKENRQAVARNAKGQNSAPVAVTSDPGYVIGPQDVLDISVWKEPDVSRTVPVRPDGMISLPLIDDLKAAGLTPTQLAASVTEKLKKYLADPRATVIVTEINSQRIYLLGEVNRAGAYPLLPKMTVLQALSSAGGFSQFADLKKIHVLRYEDGRQIKLPFNYKEAVKGRRIEQNIVLKAGDTIVVP